MKVYPFSPVAVDLPDGRVTVAPRAFLQNSGTAVTTEGLYDALHVEGRVDESPMEVRVTTGDGVFVFRRAVPNDAILAGLSPYSLPVDVITRMLSPEEFSMNLAAVVDDDGLVHTMLLESFPTGLYARYDGIWHYISDVSALSELSVVDAAPEDLARYDAADQSGRQITVMSLTPSPDTTFGVVPVDARAVATAEPSAPVVASAPVLNSLSDAPTAIAAAAANPDFRFYVTKRLAALGYDGTVPWG